MIVPVLKYIWASPNTVVGSVFFLPTVFTGGRARIVDGVLELHGGATTFFLSRVTSIWLSGGATAMTLGHIVLATSRADHDRTRQHERVHVRQCERWGPLFLPAYLSCSMVLWIRRRDAYWDNPFEREAYAVSG
jgi:hypothetical protein